MCIMSYAISNHKSDQMPPEMELMVERLAQHALRLQYPLSVLARKKMILQILPLGSLVSR